MDPRHITEIVRTLLERGFEPPLYLCAVSLNGQVLVTKYAWTADEQGMEATFLAEYMPEPAMLLPINIMVSDSTGEAARVVIHHEGWTAADLN